MKNAPLPCLTVHHGTNKDNSAATNSPSDGKSDVVGVSLVS